MKLFNLIYIVFLFCGVSACKKKEIPVYTIKGYMYTGENKLPNKYQHFKVHSYTYRRGTGLNTEKAYRIDNLLGEARTDERGYIEFAYEEQKIGTHIMFTQDLGMNYENVLIPINKNKEVEFYYPPHGWASIFLNTNGKLTEVDTFFVYFRKSTQQYPDGFEIDTVLGTLMVLLKPLKYLMQIF